MRKSVQTLKKEIERKVKEVETTFIPSYLREKSFNGEEEDYH